MTAKSAPIYQLKITLDHTHPPIWRRVLVSSSITLLRLHDVIQAVMGWEDAHLHMFTIDEQIYGDPEDDEYGEFDTLDEKRYQLRKVIQRQGQRFHYEYDFGDSWEHTLTLEKILPPGEQEHLPICLKGKRACPPDDIGGVWGYESFLEAISDPNHSEHDEYLEWVGGEFDPEEFDLEGTNQMLRQMQPTRGSRQRYDELLDLLDVSQKPNNLASLDPDQLRIVENLSLRLDTLNFMNYLKTNRVVGTQAMGNLPLKAVREVCALFIDPPELESKIGDKVHRVRSEMDVWWLFFVHMLAASANLVDGGPSQRWQLTEDGEKHIVAPASEQIQLLFFTWWNKVHWGIAYPFMPDDFASPSTKQIILNHLINLPVDRPFPFDLFADQLIQAANLTWHQSKDTERIVLHGLVEYGIVAPMHYFGILQLEFGPHPTLGDDFNDLKTLTLTPLGKKMLDIVM